VKSKDSAICHALLEVSREARANPRETQRIFTLASVHRLRPTREWEGNGAAESLKMPLSARVSTSAVCFKTAEENVNSDDHFDRPFSFMGMKGKDESC
jgi:hypothetical protein